jgi:hypothetical protein
MKRILLLSALVFSLAARAQTPAGTASHDPSVAVKVNPLSYFFGKISLLGEYNLKHKKSITFGVGIPIETTNSFLEIDGKKRDIRMKSFSAMAGYRMYLGKKTMSGFYFEPYLKYLKSDGNVTLDGEIDGQAVEFFTTSNYSGFGLGAQLGVQFLIGNRVAIDLFLLGPEANMSKHTMISKEITTTVPWDLVDAQEAEREIREQLSDIPIVGKKIEVTVDPNSKTVTSKYDGFLPGFRAGLSIGIRF